MLVLSRKIGETILIGDVELVVVDVKGSRVKLGFSGPRDVPIQRGELNDIAAERSPLAVIARPDRVISDDEYASVDGAWARQSVASSV